MKKIYLIMVILALLTLVACGDEPAIEPGTVTDEGLIVPEYDARFDNTVEDAAACYFSLLTEDGFGNYLLAFPEEFVDGYQAILEYDDETFQEAIDNATYSLHANRDDKYMGYDFRIEYTHIDEREITGSERDVIVNDLEAYCYMTPSTIEKVVEHTYDVVTYGLDLDTDEVYSHEQENKKLVMLYITGAGWYVSPTNFELP